MKVNIKEKDWQAHTLPKHRETVLLLPVPPPSLFISSLPVFKTNTYG